MGFTIDSLEIICDMKLKTQNKSFIHYLIEEMEN